MGVVECGISVSALVGNACVAGLGDGENAQLRFKGFEGFDRVCSVPPDPVLFI